MSDPSSPAPRQTKRFEQKRGAILDAAAKRFNERGIRGTSLADVSSGVGLMTNSITYYYRRKEDLAAACFRFLPDRARLDLAGWANEDIFAHS